MKVLLLQEMSGVHTELRNGLRQIGVHADVATVGENFRKYSSDINIGIDKNDRINSIKRALYQIKNIPKFKSYDIIQSISPNPFHKFVSNIIEDIVYSKNKKIFYVAAGSDPIYRHHVRELEYWPIHKDYGNIEKYQKFRKKLFKFSTIIPVCWEYKYAMNQAGLTTENIIPFPVDMSKQNFKPIDKDKKITVFHPLNRPSWKRNDFKGTAHILEAFDRLKEKYKGKVEFIAKGKMPSKEYDQFTDQVDVIVDQCRSYTYGMSAAYGLAKGKVVLSGLEDVARQGHYADCPIINIQPDVNQIVSKLDELLQDRDYIKNLSEKSRQFAEKYHSADKVAKCYLDIYLK